MKDPRGSGARGTRAKSISQMTPQQRKAFQKFKTKRQDEKVSAMGGYKSGGRAGYKFGKSVEENKYPSKGMNKLASKNPKVAKKIMGYKKGGKA